MTANQPRKRLPANPSIEHLRKQAKRRARRDDVALSEAQQRLAEDYGFGDWPALVAHIHNAVAAPPNDAPQSPLSRAARMGDVDDVRRLLAAGAAPDGASEDWTPLWHACAGEGLPEARIAIAKLLLDAGALVRQANDNGAPAISAAAARGPRELVELLVRSGALFWQEDNTKRNALDYAREGTAPDREAIIRLFDATLIEDPVFRAAVKAVQGGDLVGLNALMDRHPDLLVMRKPHPEGMPRGYFSDARLFWYVANNPILNNTPPRNAVAVARAMIARGVEQADLDYTLMLTMTGNSLRKHKLQGPMIAALMQAGAAPGDMRGVLGHREIDAIEAVLEAGYPMTAPVAAGTGRLEELLRLLPLASVEETHDAFSAAVINQHVACAAACLDAGADVNAFLSMHTHSTAAHQAATNGDVAMLEMLVARGADLSLRDTLWNGTPLGWAQHGKRRKAEAYLAAVLKERGG